LCSSQNFTGIDLVSNVESAKVPAAKTVQKDQLHSHVYLNIPIRFSLLLLKRAFEFPNLCLSGEIAQQHHLSGNTEIRHSEAFSRRNRERLRVPEGV
jgi:hypothetical protein